MSRLNWITKRRTAQLIAAADAGRLYYDRIEILRHRSGDSPAESDLAVHRRDAEIVTDLIKLGRLRRNETGAVVPSSPDTAKRLAELVQDIGQHLDVEAGLAAITKAGEP